MDDGVDLIVEFIGRNYFNSNMNLLRRDGTMVFLAFMSGPVLPPDTNIMQLLYKRLTLKGSTLRSRSAEYQRDLLRRFEKDALPLIREGKMKVEVHEVCSPLIETVEAKRGKVYPWTKVVEAHKEMEANKNSGKVGVQTQSRLLLMHQIRSSLRSRIKLFNPMHSVTIKRLT